MRPSFAKWLFTAAFSGLLWATNVFADNPPQMKMTTPISPGVMVPDKVETSIGSVNLNYGYPDEATTQKVYDNLDATRALQTYLLAIPKVNQVGMRATLPRFGPATQTDLIWENLVDSKNYRLHLPPNIPVKDFWSVIVYVNQTRSMVQTDQRFPSVSSQNKNLLVNKDGSVNVYFGPKAPVGKENN
jgi:hypothetical protein